MRCDPWFFKPVNIFQDTLIPPAVSLFNQKFDNPIPLLVLSSLLYTKNVAPSRTTQFDSRLNTQLLDSPCHSWEEVQLSRTSHITRYKDLLQGLAHHAVDSTCWVDTTISLPKPVA